MWLICSHFAFGVASLFRNVDYPVLWSAWFGVACVACVVALATWDHTSMSVAGAMTITAYLSRMCALPVSAVEGYELNVWQALMSVTAWSTLAVLAAAVFFRGLLRNTSGS